MSRHFSCGVDVCLESLRQKKTPQCPHGPTLLFERFTTGKTAGRKYYACAASRDRKECSFFVWQDETANIDSNTYKKSTSHAQAQVQEYFKRGEFFRSLPVEERVFCHTCNLLLRKEEHKNHGEHKLQQNITDQQLAQPTHLLQKLEENKVNAQYVFSQKAVDFTVSCLQELGFKKVLCIGTPRLHETITFSGNDSADRLESLLLDIDHRQAQFYSSGEFCKYNMFNHHFFGSSEGYNTYHTFITGSDKDAVVMVTDPPFGGRVEVLAYNYQRINDDWRKAIEDEEDSQLPMLLFFPYFMEPRIQEYLPTFTMLDYKVDYENHAVYHGGPQGRKFGSPVRIFTNIEPAHVILPQSEGYRFCADCMRYIASENQHCRKCNSCTSKDGHQYVHCDECGRCVKPSRIHCTSCNLCLPRDHKCGEIKPAGCHICGDLSHKRRECPNKQKFTRKRKLQNGGRGESKKAVQHKHSVKTMAVQKHQAVKHKHSLKTMKVQKHIKSPVGKRHVNEHKIIQPVRKKPRKRLRLN